MIKINRTTEYGLMALRHMSRKGDQAGGNVAITSAREIADAYGLPFEITAKTLQRLKDTGLIQSAQGSRGGYTIQRTQFDDLSLAEFLALMEGPQGVVSCSGSEHQTGSAPCDYKPRCEIQHVMMDLNKRVYQFLSGIRLAEVAEGPAQGSNDLFRLLELPSVTPTLTALSEEP